MTYFRSALILTLGFGLLPLAVRSQPVVPAADGTNTVVKSDQNRTDISGGQLSGNGANLFHSFSQFNLSEGQIANFLTNPNIQNILGRISGDNVSVINGLISVSGGNSNLFLMNPAGIVFGQNARLNVPGSFFATTATGIGFGDRWFNSAGINDYKALLGNPNQFNFNNSQVGAIVNAGNLAVGSGQSLTLLGGTVINTGQLSAPNGQVTVAAVPGQNSVRISQVGNLLSLEITPSLQSEKSALAPVSLPQLLTGPGAASATGLTTNEQGQLVLTGGQTVSAVAGSAIVSGSVNVFGLSGNAGGTVNILGEKVGLFGANINASGTDGGGTVRVGGGFRGMEPVPNALVTYVSPDSTIAANAIDRGNGGTAVIWSDNTTRFFGNISARGGIAAGNGGKVEVSGKNALTFQGEVDTRATNGAIGNLWLDPANITIVSGNGDTNARSTGGELEPAPQPNETSISELQLEQMAAGSNVVLDTPGYITLQDLPDNQLSLQARTGDTVTFRAGGVFFVNDSKDSIETQGGNINIFASSISLGGLNANGGNIALTGNGIDLRGGSNSVSSAGGTIRLQPNDSRAIRIGGTGDILGILDLTATDLGALAGGFGSIAIGRENGSSSSIAIVAPITFNSPLTLQGSSIAIDHPLNTSGSASLTLDAPQTDLGANIATSGADLTFTGNASLNADVALSAEVTGSILFSGSLDGSRALRLDAGRVLFGATVGQAAPLASLTVNARSTEVSGNIATSGDMTFNSNVTVDRTAALAATTGNIAFANTLDSTPGRANNLTLRAGGNITFDGRVGQTQRLGRLSADAASVTAASTIAACSLSVNARDSATFGGDSTTALGADIKAGNVLLEGNFRTDGGSVNLQGSREVRTGNITSNGGRIRVEGNTVAAGAIDSSSAGTGGAIALQTNAGPLTAGALNASGAIGGNIAVTSSSGISALDLNSSSTSNGNGGGVSLSATDNIQLGSINAQGGPGGAGGSVDVTTPGLFRSNNVFNDISGNSSSISTAGGAGAGRIAIRHGGGIDRPFVVGGAIDNGTLGSINAGAGNAILPSLAFGETYTQGSLPNQISLITPGAPSTPAPIPPPIPPPIPAPIPAPIPEPIPAPPLVPVVPVNPDPAQSLPASLQVELRSQSRYKTPEISPDIFAPSRRLDSAGSGVLAFEEIFTREYEKYLDLPARTPISNMSVIYETLRKNEQITGIKSAIIYMNWVSGSAAAAKENGSVLVASQDLSNLLPVRKHLASQPPHPLEDKLTQRLQPDGKEVSDVPNGEHLELVLVTANAQPQRVLIPATTRWQVLQLADALQSEITNPRKRSSISYLDTAQKLYRWLIAPVAAELTALKIDNLIVIPAAGLRSVPFVALHDGKGFLVEKYSISVMPSLSLTDTRYDNIADDEVLAMGASVFEDKAPLPAVPVELESIAPPSEGKSFLNQDFTLGNLQAQRANRPFGIIHLATHSEFQPGEPKNSYIQLWDTKLRIDQMRQLRWNEPPVNLLVLSACSTALGDEEAELGFAGLAVASGAKSALASLWEVSDEGTLGLMTEFYRQLRAPRRGGNLMIKAEALRRAQLQMLQGRVRIQDGMLRVEGLSGSLILPPEIAARGDRVLLHPYYWAAFTMIGNPW
ncbi:filamentous hemagglutinin family outer membrane protein [Oscillatoria nigro-viridis PCC 7112]|uniref:Filamentous hemagglutinin family outer membrane protein n=1 Tax=Phormidium nigroviride PCC 7112 TaxID=179408 RepID=K9VHP6_9CYAN|nr:CHAT domain-containing protein [Oscillatoria nigro-viridis]AFZ07486.1 filamentous hemagglutinin family outer membrane protein [Oscillatoria nigro-viridis PCC 7112]